MAYEGLSSGERVKLVEVAELLAGTFDKETVDGVRIEKIRGWNAHGVKYVDPANSSPPIKEMSAAAYAAEFYKISGGSLDTADFDEVFSKCAYVGNILGSVALETVGFDNIKALAASEKPVAYDDDRSYC